MLVMRTEEQTWIAHLFEADMNSYFEYKQNKMVLIEPHMTQLIGTKQTSIIP